MCPLWLPLLSLFLSLAFLPVTNSWRAWRPHSLPLRSVRLNSHAEEAGFPLPSSENRAYSPSAAVSMSALRKKVNKIKEKSPDAKRFLYYLECLSSPSSTADPAFNLDRFHTKSRLLQSVTFEGLQTFLRDQGLEYVASWSKEELLTQYLVYMIDPTIQYADLSGIEERMEYVTKDDILSNKVEVRNETERAIERETRAGPDSEDLRALRKRGLPVSSKDLLNPGGLSSSIFTGQRKGEMKMLDMMDRRETHCQQQYVRREFSPSLRDEPLSLYIAVPRSRLRRLVTDQSAVLLLPAERERQSFGNKAMRVLADELACETNQYVVLVDVSLERENNEERAGEEEGKQNYSFSVVDTQTEEQSVDVREREKAAFLSRMLQSERRQERERVFDEVVSAMHFLRSEYAVAIFSLCGMGRGAGLALEIAQDLHCLAALSKNKRMTDVDVDTLKTHDAAPTNWTSTVQQELLQKENSVRANLLALPSKWNYFLDIEKEGGQEDSQKERQCNEEREAKEAREKRRKKKPPRPSRTRVRERAINFNITEQDIQDLLEKDELFRRSSSPEEFDEELQRLRREQEKEETSEEREKRLEALLSDQRRLDVLTTDMTSDADIESALDSEEDVDALLKESVKANAEDDKLLQKERERERRRDLWLAEEAATLWNMSAIAARDELFSVHSTVPLPVLESFVPKSIVAIAPRYFERERVGAQLRLPTMVLAAERDRESGARLSDVRSLCDAFSARMDSIFDFEFQIFRNITNHIFTRPSTICEHALWQSAVHSASLWLGVYSVRDMSQLTIGAGRVKTSEKTRFSMIAPELFADVPYSRSLVNHESHPDDGSFVNLGFVLDMEY